MHLHFLQETLGTYSEDGPSWLQPFLRTDGLSENRLSENRLLESLMKSPGKRSCTRGRVFSWGEHVSGEFSNQRDPKWNQRDPKWNQRASKWSQRYPKQNRHRTRTNRNRSRIGSWRAWRKVRINGRVLAGPSSRGGAVPGCDAPPSPQAQARS